MDIKTTLERWGHWACCGTGTEMPKINIAFQNVIPESSSTITRINDSDGMAIDAAVTKLKSFDKLAYDLIIYHYVYRISQSKLAKQLGKAQSYISGLIRVAEAFIAGIMTGKGYEHFDC